MVSEVGPKRKTQYRTFEEYRERFFGNAQQTPPASGSRDEVASFGKNLARELVRRK